MRTAPTRVLKRDGREESFDAAKLAESIEAALSAGGEEPDPGQALADAVAVALGGVEGALSTFVIAAAVETALIETGYKPAARAYRKCREQREAQRGRVRVHTEEGGQAAARPWDRDRLTQSLVRNRYLETAAARRIARSVERRMLDTGLVHLTGNLVGALADNECRSLGLRGDPLGGERVGLERHAMRAWLGGACLPSNVGLPPVLLPEGADVRPHLGGELLGRFALEEILSAPQVRALEAGWFDLPGLHDWLRASCRRLAPAAGAGEEDFWEEVARARESVREVQVHWPAERPFGETTRSAPRWLSGGGARLRLSTDQAALALVWAQAGHWVGFPLQSWVALSASARAELGRAGCLRLLWSAARPAPARAGRAEPRLDGVAVINLPAAARRCRPGDPTTFLDGVREAVDLACAGLRTLARRGSGNRHPVVAVLPAGLARAMHLLLPGEDLSGDPVRRTLLGLAECFAARPRQAGVRTSSLRPPQAEGAAARLSAREGGETAAAYSVHWNLPGGDEVPAPVCFEAAPWLEFSASCCTETATEILRHTVPSLDLRRETHTDGLDLRRETRPED